jgi:hypothetical protein
VRGWAVTQRQAPRGHLPEACRVVVGEPPARPGGVAVIASAARSYARGLGLLAEIYYSRSPGSSSRYLKIPLPGRRVPVTLRIADHPNRHGVGAHFELIALDGVSGIEAARAFIDRVAAGEV